MVRLRARFGDTFACYLGPLRIVCVNRIEYVEQIFSRRNTYERDNFIIDNTRVFLPRCLRTLIGPAWQIRKRIIAPIFRKSQMPNYIPMIVHRIDALVEHWRTEKHLADDSGCLSSTANRLLLDLSLEILLGDSSMQKESSVEFSQAFFEYKFYTNFVIRALFIPPWLIKLYLKFSKDFRRIEAILHSHVDRFIQNSTRSETNLLSVLLAAEEQQDMSKNDIFAETIDLLSTTYSVTRSMIAWFLYYVSTNENVQISIKQELARLGIYRKSTLTIELINQLVYVECVCKEILRHSPTISTFAARTVVENDYLGNDHHRVFIRKGDTVLIGIYNIHHDPHLWKSDPNQFIPERFLQQDKNYDPHAYIPFGGGHRACVAQNLAWLQLKSIVARLMLFLTVHSNGDRTKQKNITIGQEESPNLTDVYLTFDHENVS